MTGVLDKVDKLAFNNPIMELEHIIGYSPERCATLKWSREIGENIMLFTSSGTIIGMDVETKKQERFFFGHTEPICCFDVAPDGSMIASAQDGSAERYVRPKGKENQKLAAVRIWEYKTARCMAILPMNSEKVICMSWSPDSKFLAIVTESITSNFSGVTLNENKEKVLYPSKPEAILLDKEN
jgi:hypothetical protein